MGDLHGGDRSLPLQHLPGGSATRLHRQEERRLEDKPTISEFLPYGDAIYIPSHLVVHDVDVTPGPIYVPEPCTRAPLIARGVVLAERPQAEGRRERVVDSERSELRHENPTARKVVDVAATVLTPEARTER